MYHSVGIHPSHNPHPFPSDSSMGKSEPQNSAPLYMFLPNGSAASSKQPSLAAAVACAKNGRLQLILPIFFDYLSRKPVESRQE